MAVADSIATQYAEIMDELISDGARLDQEIESLKRQLATVTKERDAAIAERNQLQTTINGYRDDDSSEEEDDEGPLSYCECCDTHFPQSQIAWFNFARTHNSGRSVYSACGSCYSNLQPLDLQAIAAGGVVGQ
jgi:hypothetical protein